MNNKLLPEDATKLHEEINLYINQRLVIMTTAITVFSLVASLVLSNKLDVVVQSQDLLVRNQESLTLLLQGQALDSEAQEVAPKVEPRTQKDKPPGRERVEVQVRIRYVSLLLPTALMIVLFVMLEYCQAVFKQIHVISTYLVVTESSIWEDHYNDFIRGRLGSKLRSSATTLPILMFATLGFLAILLFFTTLSSSSQSLLSIFCSLIALFLPALVLYVLSKKMPLLFSIPLRFSWPFLLVLSFAATTWVYRIVFNTKVMPLQIEFLVVLFVFESVCSFYFNRVLMFWMQKDLRGFREDCKRRWREILNKKSEERRLSNYSISKFSEGPLAAVWDNSDDDIYNDVL